MQPKKSVTIIPINQKQLKNSQEFREKKEKNSKNSQQKTQWLNLKTHALQTLAF